MASKMDVVPWYVGLPCVWLVTAAAYVALDSLLLTMIVPWLLERYRESSYGRKMEEKGLPGHTESVLAGR